jgi:hypothetical protein
VTKSSSWWVVGHSNLHPRTALWFGIESNDTRM